MNPTVFILYASHWDCGERYVVAVFATKPALEKYVEEKSTWSDQGLFEKGMGPPGAYEWEEEEVRP